MSNLRHLLSETLGPKAHKMCLTVLVAACYRELLKQAACAPPPEDRPEWLKRTVLRCVEGFFAETDSF